MKYITNIPEGLILITIQVLFAVAVTYIPTGWINFFWLAFVMSCIGLIVFMIKLMMDVYTALGKLESKASLTLQDHSTLTLLVRSHVEKCPAYLCWLQRLITTIAFFTILWYGTAFIGLVYLATIITYYLLWTTVSNVYDILDREYPKYVN